jgi:hypothetical protein
MWSSTYPSKTKILLLNKKSQCTQNISRRKKTNITLITSDTLLARSITITSRQRKKKHTMRMSTAQQKARRSTILTRVTIKNNTRILIKVVRSITEDLTRVKRSTTRMRTRVMKSRITTKNMAKMPTTLRRSTTSKNRNSTNKRLRLPPCRPRKTEHLIPLMTR